MPTLIDFRRRIRSVHNTQKITLLFLAEPPGPCLGETKLPAAGAAGLSKQELAS